MVPLILISYEDFLKIIFCKYKKIRYLYFIFTNFIFMFSIFFCFKYNILKDKLIFIKNILNDYEVYIISILTICFIINYIKFIIILYKNNISNKTNIKDKKKYFSDVCIIIPTHSPNKNVVNVIKHLTNIFHEKNLYIVENGLKNDINLVHLLNENNLNVNYQYIKKKSKTNSLYIQLNEIKDKYKYVLLIDDDTIINKDFYIDLKIFDNYSGIGFSLKTENINFLQKLISIDYLCNFFIKSLNDAKYLNGACSMWKIKNILKILKINPCIDKFNSGEDSLNGVISDFYKFKLKHDFCNFFTTESPKNFFLNDIKNNTGYKSNTYYKQRVYRRYVNGINRLIIDIFLFKKNNINYNFKKILKILLIIILLFVHIIILNILIIFKMYLIKLIFLIFLYKILFYFSFYIKFLKNEHSFKITYVLPSTIFFIINCLLKYLSLVNYFTYFLPFKMKLVNIQENIKKEEEDENIEVVIQDMNKIEQIEMEIELR